MAAEIRVGDVGTSLRATIKDEEGAIVDVSSAETLQLIFKKADDTLVTKTATLVTDGTDGKIHYVTESGFLDVAGLWQLQGYVVLSGGSWKSDIHKFRVYGNL